ncbi:cell wall hydrolase [Aureimonas ureilytica]|nr:cell wall hydrolase [Aureimonas ureilytica]
MAPDVRSRKRRLAPAARRRLALRRVVASSMLSLAFAPIFPSLALSPTPAPLGDLAALVSPVPVPAALAHALAVLPPSGSGDALYVQDPNRRVVADKGGRVAAAPLPPVQPKFAAGQIGSVTSLLRPGLAKGDETIREALAKLPADMVPIQIAASFAAPASLKRGGQGRAAKGERANVALAALAAPARNSPASVSSAAAYAGTDRPALASLFDAVLGPSRGFVPPKGENDHSWVATPLPASATTPSEQTCLATAIYFEARGETEKGQAAVAQVVLNRVRNPAYPKTICGVVYQNQDWFGRCQFSFACDGVKDIIWNKPAYALAERIARQTTNGEIWLPEVGSATHYHATYVHPRWAKTMEKVDKIGLHIFYRTFGGGWR